MLGWARREPKAEEAGLGRLGCTRRPPGDPDCYDPGQEPGDRARELLPLQLGCLCLPWCLVLRTCETFFFFFFKDSGCWHGGCFTFEFRVWVCIQLAILCFESFPVVVC